MLARSRTTSASAGKLSLRHDSGDERGPGVTPGFRFLQGGANGRHARCRSGFVNRRFAAYGVRHESLGHRAEKSVATFQERSTEFLWAVERCSIDHRSGSIDRIGTVVGARASEDVEILQPVRQREETPMACHTGSGGETSALLHQRRVLLEGE